MAKFIRRIWDSKIAGIDVPRRDRMSCSYETYLPDTLAGRSFLLESSVAADVADAEKAVVILNQRAKALVDTEALARILLRAESVASSRIEGLEVGARRLLEADAASRDGYVSTDITAAEVLGNISAMEHALSRSSPDVEISIGSLLLVHEELLRSTRLSKFAGKLRTEQNWIGGNVYNPCRSQFVPPPPEYVHELLEDLCSFCNEDQLPVLVQSAIAHAQFETIHPFVDGNGRVGRALIQMIMRRRGLAPRIVPPVSLVLATRSEMYVEALQSMRYHGSAESVKAKQSVNQWIAEFSICTRRAVDDVEKFENTIDEIQTDWLRRIGTVRSDAAVLRIVKALPGMPILSVQTAADTIGRSFNATNDALTRLSEIGICKARNVSRRNRTFEASEIIEAFTDLERRLASPAGDTRQSPPVRSVPHRRSR